MKIIVQLVVAVIISNCALVDLVSAADELVCELQVRKTQVFPFEPIEVMLSLRNPKDAEVTIEAVRPSPQISIARSGTPPLKWSDWWTQSSFQLPILPMPDPPKKELTYQPKEVGDYEIISVFGYARGTEWQGIWGNVGKFAVRGKVRRLQSLPTEITILEPKGHDAEAVAALKENGLAVFFSEETFLAGRDNKVHTGRLQEFAEKFKGSIYAEYAQLGVGLLHLKGLYKDLDAAEKSFLTLHEQSKTDVKEWATYYLAACKVEKGEKDKARQLLDNILKETKDPVLKYKADKLLSK